MGLLGAWSGRRGALKKQSRVPPSDPAEPIPRNRGNQPRPGAGSARPVAPNGPAETDVQAVAIPRTVFDDLISQSKTFRQFVFSAYSRRITDLFMVIEEVAFHRVDIRLAQRLLELAGKDQVINATHQQMAAELGTAREVISRQLQEFHRRGWVSQTRGAIKVTDVAGLTGLAQSAT